MQRLHEAGLLDALQDAAIVKYFRSSNTYVLCRALQRQLNHLGHPNALGSAGGHDDLDSPEEWKHLGGVVESAQNQDRQADDEQSDQSGASGDRDIAREVLARVGLPVKYPMEDTSALGSTPE